MSNTEMKNLQIRGWVKTWLVLSLIWSLLVVINQIESMPSAKNILQQKINVENQIYSELSRHDEDAYSLCIMPKSGKPNIKQCAIEKQERERHLVVAHHELSERIKNLQNDHLDGIFDTEAAIQRNQWLMALLAWISIPLTILAACLKISSLLFHNWLTTIPESRLNRFMRNHLEEISAAITLGLLVTLQLAVVARVALFTLSTSSFDLISLSDFVLLGVVLFLSMHLSKTQWSEKLWTIAPIRFVKGMSVVMLMGVFVSATQREMSLIVLLIFLVFTLTWTFTGTNLKATKIVGLIWMISILSPVDVAIPARPYVSLSTNFNFKILKTSYGLASGPAPDGYANMGCIVPIYPPNWLIVVNPKKQSFN